MNPGRRPLSVLLAVVAATACLVIATEGAADSYIYVEDGVAWQLNGADATDFLRRPEQDVRGVAFDGAGHLWVSTAWGDEDCMLSSPNFPGVQITTDDLAYPGGTKAKNIHLCWIGQGPGESLLVDGDYGSAGSSVIWQFNTRSLALRRIAPGLRGAASPRGAFAASRHTYFRYPRVGTWDALTLGWLDRPSSIRTAVRAPRERSSDTQMWTSPAFSASGRLAVSRDGRAVVGKPGAWTAVGPRGKSIGSMAWDSGGDLFAVTTYPCCSLIRIPQGRPGPTEVWIDGDGEYMNSLAIGPQAAAPLAAP